MDLGRLVNTSQDENTYSDFDNRPILPMDQDVLNEALTRSRILVNENDSMNNSDPNIRCLLVFFIRNLNIFNYSIKTR
jgi:hypothetical protein